MNNPRVSTVTGKVSSSNTGRNKALTSPRSTAAANAEPNEATWTDFGRAHVILDNLIASGKAKPMLIVMPDGHTMPPVPRDSPKAAEVRNKNLGSFEADLLSDVLPMIDKLYRTRSDRESRAIIGLSMGAIRASSSA